jgi:hypothetical protein
MKFSIKKGSARSGPALRYSLSRIIPWASESGVFHVLRDDFPVLKRNKMSPLLDCQVT